MTLMRGIRVLSWLLPVAALAACTVPGRGVLGPSAQRPSPAAIAVTGNAFGRVAYVTIPRETPPAVYAEPLARAIRAAEAQKPDVIFDVEAAVPQSGTPLSQIKAAEAMGPAVSAVAQSIAAAGVPESRIALGARIAAAIAAPAIRIYVR